MPKRHSKDKSSPDHGSKSKKSRVSKDKSVEKGKESRKRSVSLSKSAGKSARGSAETAEFGSFTTPLPRPFPTFTSSLPHTVSSYASPPAVSRSVSKIPLSSKDKEVNLNAKGFGDSHISDRDVSDSAKKLAQQDKPLSHYKSPGSSVRSSEYM